MSRGGICGRRGFGVLLSLAGVMIIFLCLPMEFFLLTLGVILTAVGLWLLND
ncbi:MAG: hypothetical protein IJB85_06175 [Clostridia bacterium]|nr:hypothetical protein [Clostridia bacterium]